MMVGRTSIQIQAAPRDAFYVVTHEGATRYAKALAHRLDRDDLTFVALRRLDDPSFSRGRTLVIDHAVKLTARQWETYDHGR